MVAGVKAVACVATASFRVHQRDVGVVTCLLAGGSQGRDRCPRWRRQAWTACGVCTKGNGMVGQPRWLPPAEIQIFLKSPGGVVRRLECGVRASLEDFQLRNVWNPTEAVRLVTSRLKRDKALWES